MRGVQAPCPACGAPVHFKISSSLVAVCEHCRSVVARTDRKLEDLGKIPELTETSSPLQVGLSGKYLGKRFELVGRAQYRHAAGGVWDEWYAAFPGGRWGWLAEAQGRFYLTFERKVSDQSQLPAEGNLAVGGSFNFPGVGEFTVAETGRAQTLAAEGEIPFRLEPGRAHDYADLYGPGGGFATFDYSVPQPVLFLGQEVTLDDLGISPRVVAPQREDRRVSSAQLNCPNCAGPLSLVAPDETQRVVCPNCAGLLDVDQGNLRFLKTLKKQKTDPVIPLGSTGMLRGVEYTVIGYVLRSITEDGEKYYWSEYLLYNPRAGFRWLVNSDDHWSFVQPISPGDVSSLPGAAVFQGRKFKLFQVGTATVRHVLGEFYWKVEVGEEVETADFIAPPEMISIERSVAIGETALPAESAVGAAPDALETGPSNSPASANQEVNYSLGTYVPHAEVEEAFGVSGLKRGWGVAPNQPAPVDRRIYGMWLIFAAVIGGLDLFSLGQVVLPRVDQFWLVVALTMISIVPLGTAVYGSSFERSRWRNSAFSPYDSGDDDDSE